MIQINSKIILILLYGLGSYFFIYGQVAGAQTSLLSVKVIDEATDLPTPVRIRLTDTNGKTTPCPEESISVMYGRNDTAEGYGFQPDSSFYVDGIFSVNLMPGNYNLFISKGYEYLTQHHEIEVISGINLSLIFKLKRWINMPKRGWYSADDHIHLRRSLRENPLILNWIAAEDIHVGALLQMGDFWATYFAQYAWGKDGLYQEDNRILTSGQEDPRTHEVGHTISLAADKFVRYNNRAEMSYYFYDNVFDRVHELGGLTGYAHQGMSFNGFRGMTLDILREKVDFLELLQFCVEGGPLLTRHYYFFLDLGFKLTATAGSDFPWCGKGPQFGVTGSKWNAQIGNARFYTYIKEDFSFEKWKENFQAGHTFVSSGPIVDLRINGKLPGDNLLLSKGQEVTISAEAFGHHEQIPLQRLEIVGHGNILKSVTTKEPSQTSEHLVIKMKLKIDHGIWIAARCDAATAQVAHTTPIYITVDDTGFFNREKTALNLDLLEKYLQEVENEMNDPSDNIGLNLWRSKEGMLKRIADTRQVIDQLRIKFKQQ